MALFRRAMELYPYVFHPVTVLGVGILVAIYYEWNRQDATRSALWHRIAGFLGAGVLSLVPTAAYMLATGQGIVETTQGNVWQVDALVGGGVLVTTGVARALWYRYDWGTLVPGMLEAVAASMVPYLALSPVWNVSGHVVIALAPTLYLTLVDRRFWPSLAIPAVMVPNRIVLDAHTWEQTLAGLALAAVIVVGAYWRRYGGLEARDASAAAS